MKGSMADASHLLHRPLMHSEDLNSIRVRGTLRLGPIRPVSIASNWWSNLLHDLPAVSGGSRALLPKGPILALTNQAADSVDSRASTTHVARRPVLELLVRTLAVVVVEPARHRLSRLAEVLVLAGPHLLSLQGQEEPFRQGIPRPNVGSASATA
jgi:hypothetical protein